MLTIYAVRESRFVMVHRSKRSVLWLHICHLKLSYPLIYLKFLVHANTVRVLVQDAVSGIDRNDLSTT